MVEGALADLDGSRPEFAMLVARAEASGRNVLTLHPAGTARLTHLEEALSVANDRVLAVVPPADRDLLLAALERIRTG